MGVGGIGYMGNQGGSETLQCLFYALYFFKKIYEYITY